MLFLQLFYTFLLIGLFTFGGGYSMIALIQDQVVIHHQWLTPEEFTDILAISQMTPGPIGINTATYTGYTAVVNAGYPSWAGTAGALLASFAVILLPVTLMLLVGRHLLRHKDNPYVSSVFRFLRLTIVGLIAAAALSLLPSVFAPTPTGTITLASLHVPLYSLAIFLAVFYLSLRHKTSPVLLILISGLVGLLFYSL